ncbi:MAG: DUF1311 domain-containing protein [Lachnospiraceae bacterium]|nr:DUF1311 domain-containing protein [Lachnospiraceae bacterium]
MRKCRELKNVFAAAAILVFAVTAVSAPVCAAGDILIVQEEEDLLIVQETEQAESEAGSADAEMDSSITGYTGYDEILQSYIYGFETGWDSSDFDENGLCYLAAYLSGADEMGYYLADLDGDGTEELLVGERPEEDTKGQSAGGQAEDGEADTADSENEEDPYAGMFYELYTLDTDTKEPVCVAVSGERSRYYLCTDGTIGYEGSGGASFSGMGHYRFTGTDLEVISFVLYDGDYDSENPYFYSTADTWDDHSTPISESEAAEILASYDYMAIPYLAFSETASGAGETASVAAGTDNDFSGADESASGSALRIQATEEVAAAAGQAEEIEYRLENEALSQSELNQYSYEMYQIWDDALNTLWGYLKDSLSEEEMDALTEEELVWIAEKENEAAAAGAEFEGGTMQPFLENTTAAAMTKDRVYVLLDLLP